MTLIQLFTAIANAIRGKTGSSSSIPAENFPQEIAGITTGKLTNEEYEEADEDVDDILENTTVPTGTISITANGEYDVTNYTDANVNIENDSFTSTVTAGGMYDVGVVRSIKNLPSTMTITGNSGYNMFYFCTNLLEIPELLNSNNLTDTTSMFSNCSNIETVPLFDISNVTTATSMFAYCTKLKTIPTFNTSNVTNMYQMFRGDSQLTTIPLFNTSKVINMQYMFNGCSSLSNDSLNNILAMCTGATSYTGTKTLKYIGLSSTQATTCTSLSNWASAQSAGWTTGY